MRPADAFARYRPLVDDWPAFLAALERPLPRCLWGHPGRLDGPALAARLDAAGLAATPLEWHPGAFRLPWEAGAGNSLEYRVGLYHVVDEASLLPPVLLAARPGERVLDLCAAPGGKALQVALGMGPGGTLVANDVVVGRLAPLRFHQGRLGAANLALTRWDAASYPNDAGRFDRVLADVPCTCEGTSRKSPEVLESCGRAGSERMRPKQELILRRALALCRPGGRVVYSTCTYAPEENEVVVDAAVRSFPEGELEIVPARLPGLVTTPGVERWEGRRFVPGIERTLRLWPHHNDTGGFYVAVLERRGGDGSAPAAARRGEDAAGAEGVAQPLPAGDPALWRPVLEHHGIPGEALAPFAVVRPNRRQLALVARDLAPPLAPPLEAAGIPLMRTDSEWPKLSTQAALVLGPAATRNVVELDRREAEAFVRREAVEASAERLGKCEPGFVVARQGGVALGVGRLVRGPAGRRVESLFPRRWM